MAGLDAHPTSLERITLAALCCSSLQASEVRVRRISVLVRSNAHPAHHCPDAPKAALAAVDRLFLGNKKPDAVAGFSEQVAVGKILTMAK